jgi:lysozyme
VKRSHENAAKIIRAVASASVLALLIASAGPSGALGRDWRGEPDRHRYPLRGIDVSHYQGTIDWPAVASDDVAFAYIKATEGVESRDPQFARNWRGAQRAGVRVGAYHYFIFCRSGRAQAHNFLAATPRQASTLPPAVDLEMGNACLARLTGARIRRELDEYLAVVEARYREHAVLYVTPAFYATYGDFLPRRQMWRRSILSKPAAHTSWAFWQYRSRGRVAGIQGLVDLSVFNARRGGFSRVASEETSSGEHRSRWIRKVRYASMQ